VLVHPLARLGQWNDLACVLFPRVAVRGQPHFGEACGRSAQMADGRARCRSRSDA
jgi:hypothetical protein